MSSDFVPLDTIDPMAIDALLDRAFGSDRRKRTAYRIREGTTAIAELSFARVADEGAVIGTILCWPVELRTAAGAIPMIMVGPVAVDPRWQQAGLGKQMMAHMLMLADESGLPGADALMLIGDREYYERFFGFSNARTGEWTLPGPFDRDRLLARGSQVPALSGEVAARLVRTDLPAPAPMA